MGTGFEVDQRPSDIGIIPRSVELLFNLIAERRATALANGLPVPEFQVSAQFLEVCCCLSIINTFLISINCFSPFCLYCRRCIALQ